MMPTDATPTRRSGCPIATTLDIVGDKWSLVILRDLINGKRRFGEFLNSPEGITTNILSDRLRRLQVEDLLTAERYSERPPRCEYGLTDKGRDLHGVLVSMCRWANRWMPDTWVPPERFMAPPEGDAPPESQAASL